MADKFYVKAGYDNDEMKYMHDGPDLSRAINYMNNLGEIFSQGIHPERVVVILHNQDESVFIRQECYNGYWSNVEIRGVA